MPIFNRSHRAFGVGDYLQSLAMSFNKQSESSKHKPSEDETIYANWGSLAGATIGLILTFFVGRWLPNIAMLGVLGYIIGALIDRRRK